MLFELKNTAVPSTQLSGRGNASILEYGLLYTQQSIYGTNNTLTYENISPYVFKASSLSDIPSVPYTYITGTTGLTPNTLTYYRAFAKNAKGVGYGVICTEKTAIPTFHDVNVNVNITWNCLHPGECDGIGGTFWLKCCNNTIVETYDVPNYSKEVIAQWSVPSGYYFVDFSGLESIKDGSSTIYWDISWTDGTVYDYTICTCLYNRSTSITAQIPLSE